MTFLKNVFWFCRSGVFRRPLPLGRVWRKPCTRFLWRQAVRDISRVSPTLCTRSVPYNEFCVLRESVTAYVAAPHVLHRVGTDKQRQSRGRLKGKISGGWRLSRKPLQNPESRNTPTFPRRRESCRNSSNILFFKNCSISTKIPAQAHYCPE